MDMRLRPFGDSGPLVLSFAALEDYYQEQGRDWSVTRWSKRGSWATATMPTPTSCAPCCARSCSAATSTSALSSPCEI
ncbi:hypothetical protein ACVXG7_06010 [Enterobacter hormaechei]